MVRRNMVENAKPGFLDLLEHGRLICFYTYL